MRLVFILVITAGYMVAEIVGGFLSNSLALLADAGHMLADVAAITVSLVAFMIAARPSSDKATFGYLRAEILAALFNGVVLLIVAFFIIREAIMRLITPEEISSHTMIAVALGGLLVNLLGLSLLHRDKKHNLNMQGAWLHVFSDTLGSIGVVISGILIYFFDWRMADPIASILISMLVAYSATVLILKTVRVLMEHTPEHLDVREIKRQILGIAGVAMVHDLHVWTITSGHDALSAHVKALPNTDYDHLLKEIKALLGTQFGISHTTIQVEKECPGPGNNC